MAKYELTDKRLDAALNYVNKRRASEYKGKAARPVTRLRKVSPGESVIAKTINFAQPETVDLAKVPKFIEALDAAHSRGDVPELIA